MAISLVVVSATPRATNRVSAARSTRALVSSALPMRAVYEGALTWKRQRWCRSGGETPPLHRGRSGRHRRLEFVGMEQMLGLRFLDALMQPLGLVVVAQHLGQRKG